MTALYTKMKTTLIAGWTAEIAEKTGPLLRSGDNLVEMTK
jgi:hypothetical protein